MSVFERDAQQATESHDVDEKRTGPAPGRATLTEDLPPKGMLQYSKPGGASSSGGGNQQVAASGFKGTPMDVPYRAEMERGFGQSFAGVKAYGDEKASKANEALGSKAYAVGQNVAFGSSSPDKAVVAHELAHTLQQGQGSGEPQHWSEGAPGDSYEQEADSAAATVLAGGKANVSLRTGGAKLSRWGGSDHYTIGNTAGQKAMQILAGMGIHDPGTAVVQVTEGGGVMRGGTGHSKSGSANAALDANGTGNAMTPSTHGADPNAARRSQDENNAGPHGMRASGTDLVHSQAGNQTLGVQTDAGGTISFGAASRAAGDYANTVGKLGQRTSELEGAGAGRRGDDGAHGQGVNAIQFAQMTIGGTTNSNHFYPQNGMEYRGHHEKALALAAESFQASKGGDQTKAQNLLNQAMEEEGFASHFLQDTHSSGHMAPRALDNLDALHGDRSALANSLAAKANNVNAAVGHAGATVGGALGSAKGRVGTFFSQVGHLQNPFTHAASEQRDQAAQQQGAQMASSFGSAATSAASAVTSTAQQGGRLNSMVTRVDQLQGHARDAYEGLVRSKQWHDFYCALPNGLPTNEGNYHGDYLMDGNDLERVSTKAANSIVEVLAAAKGQSRPGGVTIPHPDFAAIMADPMVGPVWKLMMSDYQADLERAKKEIQQNDTGKTDGDTAFRSMEVLQDIEQNVFGEGQKVPETHDPAQASTNLAVVTEKRIALKGIVDDLNHYTSTEFGYNQNLGAGGLDDNLNAPRASDAKQNAAEKHDYVSDSGLGASFDPCQLQSKYNLFGMLHDKAVDYQASLAAASQNQQLTPQQREAIQREQAMATQLVQQALAWKAQSDAFVAGGRLGANARGVPIGVSGTTAQNMAWGAGHPEWITNHDQREKWRLELWPVLTQLDVQMQHDPIAGVAAPVAAKQSPAKSSHG